MSYYSDSSIIFIQPKYFIKITVLFHIFVKHYINPPLVTEYISITGYCVCCYGTDSCQMGL